MLETTAAAALIIGMAGQYFAGKTPNPDPALLQKLGKGPELSMQLAAVASSAGAPRDWDCKLDKALGTADEDLVPGDDWPELMKRLPPPAPEKRAEADAYWRSRGVVYALQRRHAEGKKPALEGEGARPALEAIIASRPELSKGRVPPDDVALAHYSKSTAKRLREVAASVPPRHGWRCHDVERAMNVLQNGAERLMKNQPQAAK